MRYSRKSILGLVVVSLALVLAFAGGIGAAPNNQVTLLATDDTYINRVNPGQSYDNGLLFLQQNLTGGFETDKVALLKFNLSSVSWPIAKARLNLAVISGGCGVTSASVDEIYVYDAGNGWTENSTWTSVGGFALRGSLRDDMDETSYVAPVHLHWTDTGANSLASYLESRRQADGIASLWIQLAGTGAAQVVFEDHEGTGQAAGCTGANLKPTLQLADADQPLLVTLSDFSTDNAAPTWPLYAGLGALAVLAAVGVTLSRRRATR